jgi:hypothetical protein
VTHGELRVLRGSLVDVCSHSKEAAVRLPVLTCIVRIVEIAIDDDVLPLCGYWMRDEDIIRTVFEIEKVMLGSKCRKAAVSKWLEVRV